MFDPRRWQPSSASRDWLLFFVALVAIGVVLMLALSQT